MATDPNCIFCKIARKEIPSKPVVDTDQYIAINDINPQAPCHILLFPKQHARNILEYGETAGAGQLGSLFAGVKEVVAEAQLKDGFRCVVNTGSDGGQTVDHLHIHILGRRRLTWPPG